MHKKISLLSVLICAAVLLSCQNVFAAKASSSRPRAVPHKDAADVQLDTDLIDIPTAGITEYYGLQMSNRFISDGGVLTGIGFGVLPRLNLGASVTLEKLIGTGSPVRLVRPDIQAKYRFYDGAKYIPALAIGYDGQGYYYDTQAKKYNEKGHGLFLVGSQEFFIPGLMFHPGINMSDFESNSIFFFSGLSYTIEDTASLMLEWDNIQRFDESRLNAGVRFYVTPFFQLDFAVREIGKNGTFSNGVAQKPERVVQLKYCTSF